MRTLALSLASLALLCSACASAHHPEAAKEDDESEVAASAVPQLVKDSIAKAYPSATASEWTRETEDGVTYFEAELKIAATGAAAARSMDVLVRASDGQIVEEEERIEASALPAAVSKAIATAPFAGLELRRAERIVKNGKRDAPLFEVLLGPKGHAQEVVFDSNGKVVEKEDKSGDAREG